MSKSSRLADHRARASAAPATDDPNPPTDDAEDEIDAGETGTTRKKETPMTTETEAKPAAAVAAPAAAAEPDAAAKPDLVARMKAVLGDDKVKGKTARAAELLADSDYDGLSAEAMIKLVASQPEAAAPEDDTGKRMLAAMTVETPPIGSGGEPDPAANNYGWDKIHAEIREARGA